MLNEISLMSFKRVTALRAAGDHNRFCFKAATAEHKCAAEI